MVTVEQTKKDKLVGDGIAETVTIYGLSTDTKPAAAANGSAFVEMDSGKLYFFNAAGNAWVEWGG